MKLASAKKVASAAFFGCALVFAAGCESDAAAKPSLSHSLAELKPAIFCLDAAVDKSGVLECLKSQGIGSDYRYPGQPSSTEDFARQALVMWAGLAQGDTAHLSSHQFDSVIDYATCVEKATNALQGLEGEPKRAIGAGKAKTELACAGELFSDHSVAKRYPGLLKGEIGALPRGEAKAYLLSSIFAGLTYRYVIEANGWVTDEMRPCVRYLDGRPPSPGCAGEPELRAPMPPPSYSPK